MKATSYKVEIVEYRLEEELIVYKIVEKHYFLGIRMYMEEHPKVFRDLEYAKSVAEKVSKRIYKEYSRDILSKSIVYKIHS
jgi:hypothetical protein